MEMQITQKSTPSDIKKEDDMNIKLKTTAVKRQRSENWNEVDKELLKELIKKRVTEIENKNTDTNTNKLKQKAWVELQEDFNVMCSGNKRTIVQLKSQWTTIKIQARKDVSTFRNNARKTGGGEPSPEIALSGSDITVWLPNEFVVDTNEYDSDIIVLDPEADGIVEITSESENVVNKEVESKPEGKAKLPNNQAVSKKKKLKSDIHNSVDDNIIKLAETDVECRRELHLLQVEVEKKKIRNLDLEFELIQARLDHLKKRPFDEIEQ